MSIKLGDAVLNIGGDFSALEKALKNVATVAASSMNKVSESMNKTFDGVKAKSKEALEGFSNNLGQISEKIGSNMSLAGAGITASFFGIGVAAMSASAEIESAANRIVASFGGASSESERFKEIIKNVYNNAFGESLADVGNAISSVVLNLQRLGETSDTAIQKSTETAIALRDLYGAEVNETMSAVVALVDNFGVTVPQAFDLIAAGFQKGLNGSDDFIDSIREYSVQFAQGGMDATQFFNLLATGYQQGVLGTDKVADMFKEFRIRILDGSQTTSDALSQLGLNSEELMTRLGNGTLSVSDAFNMVIEKLRTSNDQTVVMQAGVGLLGTQFEDLGERTALGVDLAKFKLAELEGSSDKLNTQYGSLTSTLTTLGRSFVTEVLDPIGVNLNDVLKQYLPQIKEAFKSLSDLAPQIGAAFGNALDMMLNKIIPFIEMTINWIAENEKLVISIGGFIAVVSAISVPLGTLLMLLPGIAAAAAAMGVSIGALSLIFGGVVIAIGALVAAGYFLWENWDWITNTLSSAWNYIAETASSVWGWITETVMSAAEQIQGVWDWLTGAVQSIKDLVSEGLGAAGEMIFGTGDEIPQFASGGVAPGGWAVVGEQGPELVNLPRGARVYSNSESERMTNAANSSTTNNISPNINISISNTSNMNEETLSRKIGYEIDRIMRRF